MFFFFYLTLKATNPKVLRTSTLTLDKDKSLVGGVSNMSKNYIVFLFPDEKRTVVIKSEVIIYLLYIILILYYMLILYIYIYILSDYIVFLFPDEKRTVVIKSEVIIIYIILIVYYMMLI
jgi:hypothetical protein